MTTRHTERAMNMAADSGEKVWTPLARANFAESSYARQQHLNDARQAAADILSAIDVAIAVEQEQTEEAA